MLKFILLMLVATSSFAATDCLRFMSKKATLLWSKQCNVMISDSSKIAISAVDLCVGEFTLRNRKIFVVNGDLTTENRSVMKKSVIVTYPVTATNSANVSFSKLVVAPELFSRAKFDVLYDRDSAELQVQVRRGIFKLHPLYNFSLYCN